MGRVIKQKGEVVSVVLDEGDEVECQASEVVAATEDTLKLRDNLTDVTDLKEAIVLHNLRGRFFDKIFYTYIGPILIAVNPYEKLSIYSKKHIHMYKNGSRADLPPHVFAIAQDAFRSMQQEAISQSILVSGESGAGKTESTKLLLQHLAVASGQNEVMANLSSQILEANPVLEAFGNAKTLCNDNSSRFGKFIKVFFADNGDVIGGIIEQYLLETTRIVAPNPGERNYHIFYQMCAGCNEREKQALFLDDMSVEQFSYLKADICPSSIDGVDDAAELQKVRDALAVLGFDQKEIVSIWRVAAAVLHLGNVTFTAGERTKVKNQEALQRASKLFGVEPTALSKALTHRGFQGGNRKSSVAIPLTGDEAAVSRDGFSKAIYTTLFEWLVSRINDTIKPAPGRKGAAPPKFIGLLDIFGFESFEQNSLEQLLINAANESLQFQFNKVFFEHEQQEYKAEGIAWNNIKFRDNTPCVELIEAQGTGILRMLCEEGRLPQAGDDRLLSKMHAQHKANKFYGIPRKDKNSFEVKHFARMVSYNIVGFLEKNKDTVSPEVVALVEDSTSKFLRSVFEGKGSDDDGGAPSSGGTLRKNAGGAGGKRKPTVTEKFLRQLTSLTEQLDSTHRHYIRCIRPNRSSKPGKFLGSYALEQMLSSGVMETIMIRKEGYGFRVPFEEFANMYKSLLRNQDQDAKDICKQVTQKRLGSLPESFKLGKTKIFLRDDAKSLLDGKMEEIRKKAALILLHAMLRARFKPRFKEVVKHAIRERKKREEEERKRREEEERKRREEEERKRREEEERRKREEEQRRKREEEERKRREKEEAEARRREEEEQEAAAAAAAAAKKKKEEEAARKKKEEEAAKKKAPLTSSNEDDWDADEPKEESSSKTTKRRGITSTSPFNARKVVSELESSRSRSRSGRIDSTVVADSSGIPAFEKSERIMKGAHDVLFMLKGDRNKLDKSAIGEEIDAIEALLAEFLEDAAPISETRTFSRACSKVDEQCRALVSLARDVLKAQSAEFRARLQSVDQQMEVVTKTFASWKQTALALGKNISVRDSELSTSAGRRTTSTSSLASSGKSSGAFEKEESRGNIRNMAVVFREGGTVAEVSVPVTESAMKAKTMLLEQMGKLERHHVNYILRGSGSACLVVPDNSPSLQDVSWIATCFRAGVVPQLELRRSSDQDGDATDNLSMLTNQEDELFRMLKQALGPVYSGAVEKTSTAAARARLLVGLPMPPSQESLSDRALDLSVKEIPAPSSQAKQQSFGLRLLDLRNLDVTDCYLVVGLRDGTRLLTEPFRANTLKAASNKVVTFIPFADIPPGARVHITICNHSSDNVMAWCNVPCVEDDGRFVRGKQSLCLWVDGVADARFTPGQDLFSPSPPVLEVDFESSMDNYCWVVTEAPTSLPAPEKFSIEGYITTSAILQRPECGTLSMQLSDEELDLLWANRLLLSSTACALPPFLACVPWAKASARKQAHELLMHWAIPEPCEAVGLLGPAYSMDPVVRDLACTTFSLLQDSNMRSWVPMLAQAVRFESNRSSGLNKLLLNFALKEGHPAGNFVFWCLWADLKVPCFAERSGFLCDVMLRWMESSQRDSLLRTQDLLTKLLELFEVAASGKSFKPLVRDLPLRGAVLPVDSLAVALKSVEDVRWDSESNVLRMTFDTNMSGYATSIMLDGEKGESFIALQLVKVMHAIWASKGRDMGSTLYEVVNLGSGVSLSSFRADKGVLLEDLLRKGDKALAAFIDEHNKGEEKLAAARELLSTTAAALCVSSYVLGECVRDNVYVLPSGALYQARHTVRNISASRFTLIPAILVALGKSGSVATKSLAITAFDVLRKNAWVMSGALALVAGYDTSLVDRRLMEIRLRVGHSSQQVINDFASGLLK